MVQLLGRMPWDLRCARDYERMRSQFNWTQYKLLISISDPDKREYYELEAAKNFWTARELERQKNSLLYERLLRCFVLCTKIYNQAQIISLIFLMNASVLRI